jgi:hypothetical protein
MKKVMKQSKAEAKLATEKFVDFSMIAKRQTTLLMCGLTFVAQLIFMSSSNQPIYDKPTRITTCTRARSAGP